MEGTAEQTVRSVFGLKREYGKNHRFYSYAIFFNRQSSDLLLSAPQKPPLTQYFIHIHTALLPSCLGLPPKQEVGVDFFNPVKSVGNDTLQELFL